MSIPYKGSMNPLDYLSASQMQQLQRRQSIPPMYPIDSGLCHHIDVHKTGHDTVTCKICGQSMYFMDYISYMQRLILQVHDENKTLLQIIKVITTES